MTPRDQISIYHPLTGPNGSGGQVVDRTSKGELRLSALAEVTQLTPTRDELASQSRLGQTIKIKLWARKGVPILANDVLYWRDVPYTIQGPPVENNLRTEWTLYAKSRQL